jgi:cbb3-type cytochrome oxidase subunit 1
MRSIARVFIISAVIYGILGMLLGLAMAMSHDHGQLPTHAHIMVIGWLSFAVFGLFYFVLGEAVPRWLAQTHFWLAQLSLAVLVAGLWLHYSGRTQFEFLAAIGSMAYAVSFVLFAVAALMAMRERAA